MPDPSAEDLSTRLESRVRRHLELQVTGVVAFCAGYCLQLLEGDPAAIDASVLDLAGQGRCHGVQVLISTTDTRRLFPEWPLRLIYLSGSSAKAAAQALDRPEHGADPESVRRLVETLVSAALV